MLFIPAIDLIDGQCVRLERGDYGQRTRYDRDPIETAVLFQQEGARCLHIVDLDAAKNPGRNNRPTIGRIIAAVDMPVQVGGGVRDRKAVEELFDLGVDRIILGTMIVKDQALAGELVSLYGSRLAAGIDARDGMVRVSGWTEGSDLSAIELGSSWTLPFSSRRNIWPVSSSVTSMPLEAAITRWLLSSAMCDTKTPLIKCWSGSFSST